MTLLARCHCGATQIELPHLPRHAKECNCSYCARAGAIWGYYQPGDIRILANEGESTYAPSGMNQHHFCGHCGMQTWGDSPDWASIYNDDGSPKPGFTADSFPTQRSYAVNLRLVDDLDWSALAVEKVDGRNSW